MLKEYNVDELMGRLCEDWRSLIDRRAMADGVEREQLDQVYSRILPYIIEIETAREQHDLGLLGLIATAGRILQEHLRNG